MQQFLPKRRCTYIYGLADQDTKIIRYVGATENLKERYKGHSLPSSICSSKPLFKNGKKPTLVILDWFPAHFKGYAALERTWIERMRIVAWKLRITFLNKNHRKGMKRHDKSSVKDLRGNVLQRKVPDTKQEI